MRSIVTLCLCLMFAHFQGISQCIPNASITQSGIYPDSATGLAPAVVGQPYSQVMQLRVPVDTSVLVLGQQTVVPITNITLSGFNNLPPGLTYSCTPSSCVFPGGSNGCVEISGTPLVAGLFNPIAITVTSGTVFGIPLTQIDTIDYYFINVTGTGTGIDESTGLDFRMEQNSPNPADDITSIRFSLPGSGEVEFRMFNLIGKEVYRNLIQGEFGENTIRIDSKSFSEGVYMYSMTFGSETLSRRMVISRK